MYSEELFRIPPQDGEKKLSVTIRMTSRQLLDVRFEFYESADVWTVYWHFEMPSQRLFAIAREYKFSQWEEALRSQEYLNAIQKRNPVFSHAVDGGTAERLEALCANGLPAVDRVPLGFDGHSYEITLEKSGERRFSWRILPKEWAILEKIINQCVEWAQLSQDDYGCRVDA